MNGTFVAILTQTLLLFGTSAGFNQPSSASSPEIVDRISTETIQKNLNLKPGGLILLDTELGNVSIEAYDGSEVRVELRLRGTPEGISSFRFTHDFFADQLTLKGWYEKPASPRTAGLTQIEFVVMVPRGAPYAVSAVTKQGNISAEISCNMKDVNLSTEAGTVRVAMPSDLSANVDASTSGLGGVMVCPEKTFSVLCPDCEIRRDDHMKFRMNGGGSAISAYSGIGNVYFDFTPAKLESQS